MRMWTCFLVCLWSQRIWSSPVNIRSNAALRSDVGPTVKSLPTLSASLRGGTGGTSHEIEDGDGRDANVGCMIGMTQEFIICEQLFSF